MPERILHVFGTLNRGGAETLIMNIYRNIDRDKIQFDFMVHHKEEGAFENEVKSLGGKVYRIENYRGVNHFSYKKSWNDFLKTHKEYRIIHCHKESIISLVMDAAKKNNRIAIAHSHSTHNIPGFKGRVMDVLNQNVSKKADYRLACSKDAGKWMFGDTSDFLVINNGIEIEKFSFTQKVRQKIREQLNFENKIVLGHIARFDRVKNQSFLIDVLNELIKKNPNYLLVFAGDGEFKSDVEEKVKKLGLDENVRFLGSIGYVNELLQAIDIFILPSLYEGLAVSTIEAQAAGLRCLLSDNIDKNSKVTDLIEFVPIDKGVDPWVEAILNVGDYKRVDTSSKIKKAGFDIKETADAISRFYLNLLQK